MYSICIYTYMYMQIHIIYPFYIVAPEYRHKCGEADAPNKYINIYILVCVYIYMYIYMYTCIYIYIYICVCVCVCV